MGRHPKPATKIDMTSGLPHKYRPYVNYNLNPEPLTVAEDGTHVRTQLEERKRRYEALYSFMNGKKGQVKVLELKIASKESSTRSRYFQLMNKEYRTREELEALYAYTFELEALYNQLPPLKTLIRELEREIQLVYPDSLMKEVYEGLGEEFVKPTHKGRVLK